MICGTSIYCEPAVSSVCGALARGALSEHEVGIVSMLQVRTQAKEVKQRVQSDTAPSLEAALGRGLPGAKACTISASMGVQTSGLSHK